MGENGTVDRPGPIAGAGRALASWLAAVVDTVVEGPPSDSGDAAGAAVAVWPLELLPDQQVAGAHRSPRLKVRHLVCGVGPPVEAIRLLDRVLVAAATTGAPEVSFGPVGLDVWRAFGVAPRPALVFDVAVQVSRPAPEPQARVRAPLELRDGVMQTIAGRVLGPSDLPMPGVRLEVAGTGASTFSDAGGTFAIPGMPAQVPLRLLVTGRGAQRTVELPVDGPADDITVRFEFEEA